MRPNLGVAWGPQAAIFKVPRLGISPVAAFPLPAPLSMEGAETAIVSDQKTCKTVTGGALAKQKRV